MNSSFVGRKRWRVQRKEEKRCAQAKGMCIYFGKEAKEERTRKRWEVRSVAGSERNNKKGTTIFDKRSAYASAAAQHSTLRGDRDLPAAEAYGEALQKVPGSSSKVTSCGSVGRVVRREGKFKRPIPFLKPII